MFLIDFRICFFEKNLKYKNRKKKEIKINKSIPVLKISIVNSCLPK